MLDFTQYMSPELAVLVPVLYLVGMIIKSTKSIDDMWIPMTLGLIGIMFACLYTFAYNGLSLQSLYVGLIQGILYAGTAVYCNQCVKQAKKKECDAQ